MNHYQRWYSVSAVMSFDIDFLIRIYLSDHKFLTVNTM